MSGAAQPKYGKQYTQIWTKDAHGGAHRKARSGAPRAQLRVGLTWASGPPSLQAGDSLGGYDALVQHPDRTLIKREPGAPGRGRARCAFGTR